MPLRHFLPLSLFPYPLVKNSLLFLSYIMKYYLLSTISSFLYSVERTLLIANVSIWSNSTRRPCQFCQMLLVIWINLIAEGTSSLNQFNYANSILCSEKLSITDFRLQITPPFPMTTPLESLCRVCTSCGFVLLNGILRKYRLVKWKLSKSWNEIILFILKLSLAVDMIW